MLWHEPTIPKARANWWKHTNGFIYNIIQTTQAHTRLILPIYVSQSINSTLNIVHNNNNKKQARQTISTRSPLKLYSIIPLFLQQPLLVNETYLSSIKSVQNIAKEDFILFFQKIMTREKFVIRKKLEDKLNCHMDDTSITSTQLETRKSAWLIDY